MTFAKHNWVQKTSKSGEEQPLLLHRCPITRMLFNKANFFQGNTVITLSSLERALIPT